MSIPTGQFDTWRNQGAVATAKATHEAVRNALASMSSPMRSRSHEIYLQGSYRNDTNIRGDSDVDVVVQLNETYFDDLTGLGADDRRRYASVFTPATYTLDVFNADVQSALESYFGAPAVTAKNKCFTVAGGAGRLSADVVVCAQFRRYTRFQSHSDQTFAEGITFWGRHDRQQVINYPKLHYQHGVEKSAESGWFKPSVRMFKNARRHLTERGTLPDGIAPSYFVEGWLYNIPSEQFVKDADSTFYNVLKWLEVNPDWSRFVCPNWQQYLFGPQSVQWSLSDASTVQQRLTTLWNE